MDVLAILYQPQECGECTITLINNKFNVVKKMQSPCGMIGFTDWLFDEQHYHDRVEPEPEPIKCLYKKWHEAGIWCDCSKCNERLQWVREVVKALYPEINVVKSILYS